MKKNEARFFVLGGAIITLLCLLFVKTQYRNWFPEKVKFVFSQIQKNSIVGIKIIGSKTITAQKKENQWLVNIQNKTYRADGLKINSIISSLLDIKKEEIISINKNRHKELGINKQLLIINTNSGKEYQLFIGDQKNQDTNYVRVGNEDDVFTASGFNDLFSQTYDLRDLNIYVISDEQRVTSIELIAPTGNLVLNKNKDQWSIDGKKAKNDIVETYLKEVKNQVGTDIIDSNTNLGLSPSFELKIKENGIEKTVKYFQQEDKTYLLSLSYSRDIYKMLEANASLLIKKDSDFLGD